MTLTDAELGEIEAANSSGKTPVVFVHGLWLLSSSWKPWRDLFEDQGYATLAPGWPDDPATVEEAKADPDAFAGKMVQQVTDHYAEAIAALDQSPVVIGHSFGGLIAQKLAGQGLNAVTVAIDPAQFKGVTALPTSALKSAAPALLRFNHTKHGVTLTWEQFQFGWVNALDEEEGRSLYDTYHVPASSVPIFQAATANFNPFAETKVDTENHERGPLLLIAGASDNTVPQVVVENEYRLQAKNPGDTELAIIPNRGHSLIIDSGWREVGDTALEFVQRYLP
ncbi:alpha/beta hydrolase [Herbiconiux moechotypicola]|uniref:Alpha/beta fold hydrolase n=1 Tax=Herbiconiux moechotypicola TaxID=637393 RepID=A0ABP5QEA2_9MICO|nr:alpha/beta hydrolase [Herbiconiux moechotypicola]MCS5729570.1 alpha/beta hydrolase [Herbiconiux moechotypicola]